MRSLAAIITLGLLQSAWADSWGPIQKTEFYSSGEKSMVRITPHEDFPDNPGKCMAELFRIDGGQRRLVWSRYLVNNYAPVRVYTTNSAEYVVTMDEWHSVGELPVVVYGRKGNLTAVHHINSLGLEDDIVNIKMTVSSYWWNEDSLVFFGPEERRLVIRLHWGKILVIDLATGLLETSESWSKKFRDFIEARMESETLRCLESESPDVRKTGALVAGQLKIKKAAPLLRKLLVDESSYLTGGSAGWTEVFYVRKAAKEALGALGERVDKVVVERPGSLSDD